MIKNGLRVISKIPENPKQQWSTCYKLTVTVTKTAKFLYFNKNKWTKRKKKTVQFVFNFHPSARRHRVSANSIWWWFYIGSSQNCQAFVRLYFISVVSSTNQLVRDCQRWQWAKRPNRCFLRFILTVEMYGKKDERKEHLTEGHWLHWSTQKPIQCHCSCC